MLRVSFRCGSRYKQNQMKEMYEQKGHILLDWGVSAGSIVPFNLIPRFFGPSSFLNLDTSFSIYIAMSWI